MLTYACDNGVTFWDTADIYGSSMCTSPPEGYATPVAEKRVTFVFLGEETLGKWFASTGRRSEIFLASKFGAADMRDESERPEAPNENGLPPPNSKPSYILRQLQRSLSLLQTDHIDLYYQHRPDPQVPIEVVLEALRPAFEDGRIRWFGMSECSLDVVRRAKAVDELGKKVICVQMEYGPFELVHERSGLLAEVEKLAVGVVAYSPLNRGLITGKSVDPSFLLFFLYCGSDFSVRLCVLLLGSAPGQTLKREITDFASLVSARPTSQQT